MEISPSVFVRAKCKVQLRDESFTWVQESGVFAKLLDVRVLHFYSYFGYFLSKSHLNGIECFGAVSGRTVQSRNFRLNT